MAGLFPLCIHVIDLAGAPFFPSLYISLLSLSLDRMYIASSTLQGKGIMGGVAFWGLRTT